MPAERDDYRDRRVAGSADVPLEKQSVPGEGWQIIEAGQASMISPLVWISLVPSLLNGATAYGDPYHTPSYSVAFGQLYLRGAINPGTDGEMVQLPDEAIPSGGMILPAFGDGVVQPVEIRTDGVIDFFGNPGASAFLDGICIAL